MTSTFGFETGPPVASTLEMDAQSSNTPSIRIGYAGPWYSGTMKSGIRRSATDTSGIRYSFHPALRIIPRTPEEWKPAGRTPPNPLVRPFVRPTPLVRPLVRPSPFVSPLVRPRSPFVRPFRPFVLPVRRGAPRWRTSPLVIPFVGDGFEGAFSAGFGMGGGSTSGFG